MQADVSFIIAAWRAADTVGTAIEAALAQQGVTVECIVVDDCSGDDTADAARAVGDPRVKVISLPENRGPAGARNAALDAASGRWIAVLDCDDSVQPQRLARIIARGEMQDAVAVLDNLLVQENGVEKPMFPDELLRQTPEITLEAFILSNRMFRSRFNFGYMKPVLRRAFIEQHAIRYPESLRIGEDFIFLATVMAKGGRCVVEPEPGYAYAIRQDSISRILHPRHVAALLAADDAFTAAHDLPPDAERAMAAHRKSLVDAASFLTLVDHLKKGEVGQALREGFANPSAIPHLRMPLTVRLQRLARPLPGFGN